MEANESKLVKN